MGRAAVAAEIGGEIERGLAMLVGSVVIPQFDSGIRERSIGGCEPGLNAQGLVRQINGSGEIVPGAADPSEAEKGIHMSGIERQRGSVVFFSEIEKPADIGFTLHLHQIVT